MSLTFTDLPERIAARIVVSDEHWIWTGWCNDAGYGYVHWQGRDQPVHRVVYQLVIGPIPDGHDVDHVCQVTLCCRPHQDHLEAVTHAENMRRIRDRQMTCRRSGHDWSDRRNVRVRRNGRRYCAECEREDQRRRYAEKKRRPAA